MSKHPLAPKESLWHSLRDRMGWQSYDDEPDTKAIIITVLGAPAGVSMGLSNDGEWHWWSWGFAGIPGGQVDHDAENEDLAKHAAEYWMSGMLHRLDCLAEVERLTAANELLQAERDVLRSKLASMPGAAGKVRNAIQYAFDEECIHGAEMDVLFDWVKAVSEWERETGNPVPPGDGG